QGSSAFGRRAEADPRFSRERNHADPRFSRERNHREGRRNRVRVAGWGVRGPEAPTIWSRGALAGQVAATWPGPVEILVEIEQGLSTGTSELRDSRRVGSGNAM